MPADRGPSGTGHTPGPDAIRDALGVCSEDHCGSEEEREILDEAAAALDALLAVGERDRRQIAQLTERDDWLLKQIDGCIESAETVAATVGLALARAIVGDLRDARAVLAGEEDAGP